MLGNVGHSTSSYNTTDASFNDEIPFMTEMHVQQQKTTKLCVVNTKNKCWREERHGVHRIFKNEALLQIIPSPMQRCQLQLCPWK
mmetsp:Transcript_67423/g.133024  ORF Transcript_67423/g.133024 Transcript_67423/m.133024 type:complete len:85 (+) Transcript_67423:783-1037(+)